MLSKASLQPVYRSSQGDLYSEDDILRFKHKFDSIDLLKEILGGTTDECSLALQNDPRISRSNIVSVQLYFDPYFAIQDGYFVTEMFPQKDMLTRIEAPSMVITFSDSTTGFYNGYLAGYYGKGTRAAVSFMQSLGASLDISELIYTSATIKYLFKDEHITCSYKMPSDILNYHFRDRKFYLFNDKAVKLFEFYNEPYLKKNELEDLYDTIIGFVGENFRITVLGTEEVELMGRFKVDVHEEECYPIVIEYGMRELWIAASRGIINKKKETPSSLMAVLELFFELASLDDEKQRVFFSNERKVSLL